MAWCAFSCPLVGPQGKADGSDAGAAQNTTLQGTGCFFSMGNLSPRGDIMIWKEMAEVSNNSNGLESVKYARGSNLGGQARFASVRTAESCLVCHTLTSNFSVNTHSHKHMNAFKLTCEWIQCYVYVHKHVKTHVHHSLVYIFLFFYTLCEQCAWTDRYTIPYAVLIKFGRL